jgi:beta-glucosidase
MRETPAHVALAREVARRGIVLLRNESSALPFDSSVTRIALLGRNADVANIGDDGSSSVRPTDVVTALEGLRERATVDHVSALDAASEPIVRAADAVVIVTGLDANDEGEGEIGAGDRATLALLPNEVALIRAAAAIHPRVVVVLEGGAAITTSEWDADVEALLFAFYPGSEGGRALADVLFGDAAPSGRLPFSIPVDEAQLPPFDNVSETVTYGYFHGYRHLEREGTPARWPFGHGLSYTTFAYSGLSLSAPSIAPTGTLTATVTVANTGSVRAIETVQLYVSAIGSRVERAPQDLRAFAQVDLGPGESRAVALEVRAEDLAFWDTPAARWEVEPIEHEVRVGPSSAGPHLAARFRVE